MALSRSTLRRAGALLWALPLLGALARPALAKDYIVTKTFSGPTSDEFLVEQMNFKKQNGFDVPEIPLFPGDHVTFEGDGCVNRGGLGDTCYRWVDPVDGSGDPNDFYYGSVTVRGTASLNNAQLRFLRGREFDVLRAAFLHVGYMDNQYDDNTNSITDEGPSHQCRGTGPARLRVRVRHTGPPAPPIPPKPYDLVSDAVDGNGLLLNPLFQIQKVKGQDAATGYPGSMNHQSEEAFYHTGWYDPAGMPALTNQGAQANTDGGWCPKLTSTIDGHSDTHVVAAGSYLSHVTYFPVSYVTRRPPGLEPASEHETNDHVLLGEVDFNLNIWPYPPNKTRYVLHSETDGWVPLRYRWDPTVGIDSTPFWNEVWGGGLTSPNLANKLASLDDRRIFMTGLFNVDVYHDPDTGSPDQSWESHPAYALAVSDVKLHDFGPAVSEELWHVFVRDRGQGGYCDRATHLFSFEKEDQGRGLEVFSFDLPVEAFNPGFTVDKIDLIGQDLAIKNPAVHQIRNVTVSMVSPTMARLRLSFDRSADPDNEQYFLVMGDVRVRYTWRQGAAERGWRPARSTAAASASTTAIRAPSIRATRRPERSGTCRSTMAPPARTATRATGRRSAGAAPACVTRASPSLPRGPPARTATRATGRRPATVPASAGGASRSTPGRSPPAYM